MTKIVLSSLLKNQNSILKNLYYSNLYFFLLIILLAFIFLFSFFIRIDFPLHAEQVHFVEEINTIKEKWYPKYDLWLTHIDHNSLNKEELNENFKWTMWHPPLYQYFMSIFVKPFSMFSLEPNESC